MSAEPAGGVEVDSPNARTRNVGARVVFLQLIGLMISASLLLWPTTASLLSEWQDTKNQTYTHGLLIVAVSMYLLFRDRGTIAARAAAPSIGAAIVLALMSVLWLVMLRAGIEIGYQALLPPILGLSVWALFGRRAAAACAVAFGFLFFAIPVWSLINGVLQEITVVAVKLMVTVASIPAYVEGNMVQIAAGTFEIAGGCSGLHFFIVAVAIGALTGELNRDSLKIRCLILFVAALIALVSNWIRVFTIIAAGYLTDMQHYLVQVDHYMFGWLLFAAAMLLFFWIVRRLPAPPAAKSNTDLATNSAPSTRRAVLTSAAIAAVIAVGPAWGAFQSSSGAAASYDISLPARLGDWTETERPTTAWEPVYRGADATALARYRSGAHELELYTAIYLTQRQGKELIGYHNSIAGRFSSVRSGTMTNAGGSFRYAIVEEAEGTRSAIVYIYQIGERRLINSLWAQLSYGIASLFEQTVSKVIAARAPCDSDCDATIERLADAIAAPTNVQISAERTL